MVGFMGMGTIRAKMKRKEADDLDQVSHDFSDFSLSSPARKIRRLDAELPPIMEEEEPEIYFPSSMAVEGKGIRASSGPVIEELDSVPDPLPVQGDRDKAIVLFKPLNSPLFHSSSPSNISVSFDSNLISGFKDQFIRARNQKSLNGDNMGVRKECLAVVPWAPPSQLIPPTSGGAAEVSQGPAEPPMETMEAEEEDNMEIEDANPNANTPQLGQVSEAYAGIRGAGEAIPQWHQQHCMVPQPPHHASTPITWFQ